MKRTLGIAGIIAGILIVILLAISGISFSPQGPQVYRYQVVNVYPHDRFAFTEGLAYDQGVVYESTGLVGNSSIRTVNLTTGNVTMIRNLSGPYFGEGITVFGSNIVELTETSGMGFIFNRQTFTPKGSFDYQTEGWGIAWDGNDLIMSDGTSTLHFLNPVTFKEKKHIGVTSGGVPVTSLNELEVVNGDIYANIWPTDTIAIISPETGIVEGWVNLSGLLSPADRTNIGYSEIESLQGKTSIPFKQEACLNGIAYDATGKRLFVTGKLWPSLFEIRLVKE